MYVKLKKKIELINKIIVIQFLNKQHLKNETFHMFGFVNLERYFNDKELRIFCCIFYLVFYVRLLI